MRGDEGFLFQYLDAMDGETFFEEMGLSRRQFSILEDCFVSRILSNVSAIHKHILNARMKVAALVRYCRKCNGMILRDCIVEPFV